MLNRSIVLLLSYLVLFANSVMADPPISAESYESVPPNQSSAAKSAANPAPRPSPGRLVQSNTPAVKANPNAAPPAKVDSVRSMKTAPMISEPTGKYQSPATCQDCASRRQWEGWRGCRGACFYGADPFGFCVRNALNAQVTNGLAAQLVFYRYDFVNVPTQGAAKPNDFANLNPQGRRQLLRVAEVMGRMPLPPVVIESSGNAQIDEARRQIVIAGLTDAMGSPVPAEWVVVDEPIAHPLAGIEASIIHESLLRQTEAGGLYDANDRNSGQSGGQSTNSNSPTNINR
jgi:hypothetical protein